MSTNILDFDTFLAPIAGENPSGEDLRYSQVYDQIKEARRADDVLDQGDWQTDIKKADWDAVIKIASAALNEKTKDLQIAVWLTEGLIKKHGYAGLADGLFLTASLLSDFWDTLYPFPDEGDLEYRIGPLEFLNEKVSYIIREISLTDPKTTEGYSWYIWQESRKGGEGDKVGPEEFDTAVNKTSRDFYVVLAESIETSLDALTKLDSVSDEKFGSDAPGLTEVKKAIEDAQQVVESLLEAKGGRPAPTVAESDALPEADQTSAQDDVPSSKAPQAAPAGGEKIFVPQAAIMDQGIYEEAVWRDAQNTFKLSGIKDALTKLLTASSSSPSVRQQSRYRLMMAKIALQANRPGIALPIIEELYELISELHLEQWESPLWVAEVIEAYYQCLTAEGATDDDVQKANSELYPRLCSKDITKALQYKKGG